MSTKIDPILVDFLIYEPGIYVHAVRLNKRPLHASNLAPLNR